MASPQTLTQSEPSRRMLPLLSRRASTVVQSGGVGERFAANPVNRHPVCVLPLVTSPGRSGFGPQTSRPTISESGNGPLG